MVVWFDRRLYRHGRGGYWWLQQHLIESLNIRSDWPGALATDPAYWQANLPAYQGPHPRTLQRPQETYDFPIPWGEVGPNTALFAGDNQYPFLCQTLESGLGQPRIDNEQGYGVPVFAETANGELTDTIIGYSKDCGLPTQLRYFASADATPRQFTPVEQVSSPAADSDLLVRIETGTINRFVYALLMPTTKRDLPDQPDLSQWNGRAVYHFKGAIGIGFQQGKTRLNRLLRDMRPALEKGYAVLFSTGTETDNLYNITLQEDTALRVKQQFISRFAAPEFIIGFGDSGGGLQQYLLGQNRPGLIDGGVAIIAYPDMVTQISYGLDCELMEYFFDHLATDQAFWRSARHRSYVQGLAYNMELTPRVEYLNTIASALRLEMPPRPRGATECNYAWRGSTALINNPKFNSHYSRFAPAVNDATFWTHWQDNRDVYGTDANGRAPVPSSNVGVQYGLQAWQQDLISAEQFFDLNRKIGSWKPQQDMQQERLWLVSGDDSLRRYSPYGEMNMTHNGQAMQPAPRRHGSLTAARAAYASGNVFIGTLDIPIIDVRPYRDLQLDIHHSWAALSSRARIMAANQGDRRLQTIWISDPGYDARWDAFAAMERWLDARLRNPGVGIPDYAEDRCLDERGGLIASGQHVWDGQWNQQVDGVCSQRFPFFQSSRQAAGDDARATTLFCQLIPVSQAISSGLYYPLDVKPYQAELEHTFPQGVCDYRLGDQAASGDYLDTEF
ncbi:hypothetical protein CHH28_13000 [Bacterioplanes sanyensis]|uniref:DUF6351 domain-containing protein n=1 Tax=Bacterioplanes sanyensis TaxID=1249553 RepID=A0A222FLS0_9GAMM|nr:DUF6351 family protein [Bacterioplanes sanyensis]ASP39536.1 hypothetical protein CHH28_13000 [Bacterioplanes sanyensis]